MHNTLSTNQGPRDMAELTTGVTLYVNADTSPTMS